MNWNLFLKSTNKKWQISFSFYTEQPSHNCFYRLMRSPERCDKVPIFNYDNDEMAELMKQYQIQPHPGSNTNVFPYQQQQQQDYYQQFSNFHFQRIMREYLREFWRHQVLVSQISFAFANFLSNSFRIFENIVYNCWFCQIFWLDKQNFGLDFGISFTKEGLSFYERWRNRNYISSSLCFKMFLSTTYSLDPFF